MKKMYEFERAIMEFDGIKYQVIRMRHFLNKDMWKDRCRVFQLKEEKKEEKRLIGTCKWCKKPVYSDEKYHTLQNEELLHDDCVDEYVWEGI